METSQSPGVLTGSRLISRLSRLGEEMWRGSYGQAFDTKKPGLKAQILRSELGQVTFVDLVPRLSTAIKIL